MLGGLEAYVVADEFKARVVKPLLHITFTSTKAIIHTHDLIPLVLHQLVDQMRSDEATSSSDQDPAGGSHNGSSIVCQLGTSNRAFTTLHMCECNSAESSAKSIVCWFVVEKKNKCRGGGGGTCAAW